MPRTKTKPAVKPNALIASAARVSGRTLRVTPQNAGNAEPWQTEAWAMLDQIGELDFYRIWKSNLMSRVVLKPVEYIPDPQTKQMTPHPVTSGPAWDAHQALFNGEAGMSQMMGLLGGLLSIPGEAWLFGIVAEPTGDPEEPDQWRVLSQEEIKLVGGEWQVDRGDGNVEKYAAGTPATETSPGAAPEAIAIRIWIPHPRRAAYATTSVRAALPILRELRGLEQRTGADIDSRLMGNGLLVVPSEATFTTPSPNDDPADPEMDPLMAGIIDTAVTAIADRNSPAAVAPGIIRAPGQWIEHIQHIKLSTSFDEKLLEMKAADLGRLSTSLDCPGDVLQGMTDVNHWTGWLLDENNIKAHIEPLAETIAVALQTRYLWFALQGSAERFDPELRRFGYQADTSALRQRVDKAAPAAYLHDNMIITDAALARETGGFGGDDILDPEGPEFQRRWLEKVASGAAPPDSVVSAIQMLGVKIPDSADAAAPAVAAGTAPPPAIEAPPPVEEHPVPEQQQNATLLVASDLVVQRALERARNRVTKRSRSGALRPVSADQLDVCLAGAWEQVPFVASAAMVDEQRLEEALDTYCRAALTEGVAHERRVLGRVLRERGLIRG